jgi:hypothetical protein
MVSKNMRCILAILCVFIQSQQRPSHLKLQISASQGIILVFSLVDEDSFQKIPVFLDKIREHRPEDPSTLPMVLVG